MKKRWIAVVIGLCFLTAGIIFYFKVVGEGSDNYNIIAVTKGRIAAEIKDEGIFNPVIKIEVGAKIAGNVTEIFVKEGDVVKSGVVLATVESISSRKKMEKSEARLTTLCLQAEGIKNIVATNLRHLKQNKKLDKDGIIAKEDLWKAEDDYEKSLNDLGLIAAQILEAQVDLEIAKIDFENSFIRSPINGIVLAKYVEIGQTVSAGFSVFKMFDICSSISELEFFAKVNSIDISAVQIGQKIKIKVNTAAGIREFCSIVSEKRDNPVFENNVPIYNVIAKIDNKDLILKPGMTGKFFVTVVEKNDILVIQRDALKKAFAFSGKNNSVMVLTEDRAVFREIETGISGDNSIEISGEIRENDLIIIGAKKDSGSGIKTPPWQSKTR